MLLLSMQEKCWIGEIDMREIGVVESTNETTAVVSVKRSSSCGESCATCSAHCNLKGNKIIAKNKVGATAGDLVTIEMSTATVLKSAFMVYILPLLMLFLGYFLTEHKTGDETKSLVCAFVAFIVTFIFLLIWDRKNKNKFTTTIIEIIEKRN